MDDTSQYAFVGDASLRLATGYGHQSPTLWQTTPFSLNPRPPAAAYYGTGGYAEGLGYAVAMTSAYVVIGASAVNVPGWYAPSNKLGKMWIVRRSNDIEGWKMGSMGSFSRVEGLATEGFGHSVAITQDATSSGSHGSHVFVGAPLASQGDGKVIIYLDLPMNPGSTVTLTPPTPCVPRAGAVNICRRRLAAEESSTLNATRGDYVVSPTTVSSPPVHGRRLLQKGGGVTPLVPCFNTNSFGWALDATNDYAVVAANRQPSCNANDHNTAYVYRWTGTTWDTAPYAWMKSASSSTTGEYDEFAYDVAISTDYLAASAPRIATSGKVYIYRTGVMYGLTAIATLSPPAIYAPSGSFWFGKSISMADGAGHTYLAVAAPGPQMAFVYRHWAGSAHGDWALIMALDGYADTIPGFGASIDITGNNVIVGSITAQKACIFEHTAPTNSPTKTPTNAPTTKNPTMQPTRTPTTKSPTKAPTTKSPTKAPTTKSPTKAPFNCCACTSTPTPAPTKYPLAAAPSGKRRLQLIKEPTKAPAQAFDGGGGGEAFPTMASMQRSRRRLLETPYPTPLPTDCCPCPPVPAPTYASRRLLSAPTQRPPSSEDAVAHSRRRAAPWMPLLRRHRRLEQCPACACVATVLEVAGMENTKPEDEEQSDSTTAIVVGILALCFCVVFFLGVVAIVAVSVLHPHAKRQIVARTTMTEFIPVGELFMDRSVPIGAELTGPSCYGNAKGHFGSPAGIAAMHWRTIVSNARRKSFSEINPLAAAQAANGSRATAGEDSMGRNASNDDAQAPSNVVDGANATPRGSTFSKVMKSRRGASGKKQRRVSTFSWTAMAASKHAASGAGAAKEDTLTEKRDAALHDGTALRKMLRAGGTSALGRQATVRKAMKKKTILKMDGENPMARKPEAKRRNSLLAFFANDAAVAGENPMRGATEKGTPGSTLGRKMRRASFAALNPLAAAQARRRASDVAVAPPSGVSLDKVRRASNLTENPYAAALAAQDAAKEAGGPDASVGSTRATQSRVLDVDSIFASEDGGTLATKRRGSIFGEKLRRKSFAALNPLAAAHAQTAVVAAKEAGGPDGDMEVAVYRKLARKGSAESMRASHSRLIDGDTEVAVYRKLARKGSAESMRASHSRLI